MRSSQNESRPSMLLAAVHSRFHEWGTATAPRIVIWNTVVRRYIVDGVGLPAPMGNSQAPQ